MRERSSPPRLAAICDYFLAFSIPLTAVYGASTPPQPIVATTTTDFVGYDGQWSPVQIRVGSPQQWLSVLPNTLSQETWVIGTQGCDGTTTCQSLRGGLFESDKSSTFQAEGFYELGFDLEFGYSESGYYGLDALALNDDVSEPGQVIAVLNSTDVWTGQIGLNVQQTRLDSTVTQLPLLSSLVQNGSVIPSHSYGYTAGAFYRLKGVPASLVLGGIDANRFTPNNISFTLGSGYEPIVAINSIVVDSGADSLPANWETNPMELLDSSNANIFTVDTSTPFLWLPEAVCDAFAKALNLTYNETLQLYLFGEEASPDVLKSWDLSFSFSLGNSVGAADNVELTIPYDAFNLQLSYPFPNLTADYTSPPTNYFPLRKAASNTEYIIGRAFLQETYVQVDYERNTFSLSQAVFTDEAVNNVDLLSITRPADSIFPGPQRDDSGLSVAAKAGIGVAIGVMGVVIIVLVAFWWRRRHRPKGAEKLPETPKRGTFLRRFIHSPSSQATISELVGDRRHPTEVAADSSNSRFELSGDAPVEMPAANVSPAFFQTRGVRAANGSLLSNPRAPVELEHRRAATKEDEAASSERSASPVPPYSPSTLAQRLSNSISPYSRRHSNAFGTASSGEQNISPVDKGSSGNNSSRHSSNIVSPISPETTMPGFATQSVPSSDDCQSPTGSDGPGLVPQPQGQVPSRSASRSSRFVEEGIGTNSDQGPRSGATSGARFSWEE